MDLGVAGKVALVTASSKGLGLASARALAAEGATVVMCARGADTLEREAAAIGATAIVADVTDPGAPAMLVAETVARHGALDILVANAGGPPPARAFDITDDALLRAYEANFLTSVRLVREAVPHMRAARWGRVCMLSSFGVKQPIPELVGSNTARTALWAWAKTAARDLSDTGITVNLVCPGLHDTDRVRQLGRAAPAVSMGEPADFGRIVAFVCSAPAGFISGTALQVDGGSTLGLL